MTMGERVRTAREAARLTQEDLGKLCGTTKQTIYKYEIGKVTNIPLDRIEAISSALGVTPAYLAGWDESPAVPDNHPSSPSLPIQRITQALPRLNDEGQAKLADYADDLVSSGRYLPDQKSK